MNTHTDINNPYWIAKNNNDSIVHYGKIEEGQNVTTSRPITTFNNKQEWLDSLKELNVDTSEL